MTRRKNLLCLSLALMLMLGGCAESINIKLPTAKTPPSRADERHHLDIGALEEEEIKTAKQSVNLRVGFVYVGTSGDYGFTYAQNQGRLALEDELGVQTMALENVPEDERCMEAMQTLIDNGCTVIFSCSYGYMGYTAQMAEMYPHVYFFHCSGNETRENMSVYFGRMYQARYLTGIVAGLRTETNKIGYIAAYPIPEVIRGVDAFALGVKRVNPDAKIYIKWSDTWIDHGIERELALRLLDEGCDVLAQHQDTISPQIVAQEQGAWSIGYNSPMGFFAKDAYLTGAVWDWAPYMIGQVQAIASGTWKSSDHWDGLKEGIVRLEPLTGNVAEGTQEAVNAAIQRILEGFDIFEGPVYGDDGQLRIPEGVVLTDEEKLSMDWYVDNIVGASNEKKAY